LADWQTKPKFAPCKAKPNMHILITAGTNPAGMPW
jgi:hypothetical protein